MEVDPFGRYLYVAAQTTRTIDIFRIRGDGSLDASALPQDLLAGEPVDLAVDPSGRFVVFGANGIGGAGVEPAAIFVYTIDDDAARAGELDFRAARPIGSDILAVQVGPSGRFLYVGLQDQVVVLHLLPDGGLAPGELALPLAGANSGFSFSRSGATCYVEIPDRDLVGAFTVSNADGSLAAIANRPTNTKPIDVLAHPKGNFAFVAISNGPARNGGLDSYRVEPDGSLGDVVDQDLDPVNPFDIEFSGGGNFLFAANEGGDEVVVYDVDGTGGTLSFRSAAGAGTSPVDVAAVRAFR
jgi:6-phosphogluconolactonase (cycloisomerase 2 family)